MKSWWLAVNIDGKKLRPFTPWRVINRRGDFPVGVRLYVDDDMVVYIRRVAVPHAG